MDSSGKDLEWTTDDNGAGGIWKAGPNFIQFDIANDKECNGTASSLQSGTATMSFNNDISRHIVMSMEGRAESEYETFELFVDDILEFKVVASDGPTCRVDTCKMCEVQMEEKEIVLDPGAHTIRVEINTKDENYHHNAFFRINFAVKQTDTCQACVCPKLGIWFHYN